MQTLKQQVVCGYVRQIEAVFPKTYALFNNIPSSIIWIILLNIEDRDVWGTSWRAARAREIIHIQVGQCGNQIGNAFWENIVREHNLDENGSFQRGKNSNIWWNNDDYRRLDKISVYFSEQGERRFVPRACFIDMEPGIMDVIKMSPMGKLFKPDNMCFGYSGESNYAKIHYTEGAELIDEAVDIIRRETESCNSPQGFQLTHSLGGATGSAMGTLLLLKIRDNYADRITTTWSVYPSPKVSDVVVEPYHAVLAIHQLLENSDQTFVIDNEALFSISHNVLKQKEPKYADLNWVISNVMNGVTSSLRFDCELNSELREMGINLVSFPRLHFFLLSQAPLYAVGKGEEMKLSVEELTDAMWSSRNWLANVKGEDGKYLTTSSHYKGLMATQEVDDEMAKIKKKMANDFVKWIPDNIKYSILDVSPKDTAMNGTLIANTTAIKGVFQRISAQFAKMYRRKAFLHWYKGEGMDEMEFQEADKNVRDLITEYQDKQDAVVDLDEDESDDEDDEDEDDEDDEEEEDNDEEDF